MSMKSMFAEKDTPSSDYHWSMTRVVAFMFAGTICYALVMMAMQDHAHDIGWPFCALGMATLLAVPLQALFRYIQVWFVSSPGQKLLYKMLDKFEAVSGIEMPNAPTPTTTTTTTTGPTPETTE